MSELESKQKEQILSEFIKSYGLFKSQDDAQEIIHNIVIPNFHIFACELEEIISQINSQYSVQSESMDFIETIFNPNLYQVILEAIDKTQDRLTHYLIILIEFTKLTQYNLMSNRLAMILSDEKITNTILSDGIKQASNERIDSCQQRIKQVYWDLEKSYPNFTASKYGIQMLFESNDFSL